MQYPPAALLRRAATALQGSCGAASQTHPGSPLLQRPSRRAFSSAPDAPAARQRMWGSRSAHQGDSTSPALQGMVRRGQRRGVSSVVFQRHVTPGSEGQVLDYAGFKSLVEETGVQPFSDGNLRHLFEAIDKDGNGVVDREEFLAWWPEVHQMYIESSSPLAAYDVLVAAEEIAPDAGQLAALKRLQVVHDALAQFTQSNGDGGTDSHAEAGFFASLFGGKTAGGASGGKTMTSVKGLYIHGGVGCGKSFMMDLFFDKIPVKRKKRVHFNQFMLDVHLRMHEVKKKTKSLHAIEETARLISEEVELLCFDEFQITDIGDAMIVKGLFTALYNNGLCMVATSNRAPEDLYEGGLNRHKFLPFIDVIKEHCDVHKMQSQTDYRREGLALPESVYFTPCDSTTDAKVQKAVDFLAGGAALQPSSVRVFGRNVPIRGAANGVAVFTFDDLCKSPLSEADFGAIAKEHFAVVVKGVPAMTLSDRTEARRFIYLVDELYERKCKMICTADVAPDDLFTGRGGGVGLIGVDLEAADALGVRNAGQSALFTGSDEVFAFGRAVSRLNEMQRRDYLLTPHSHLGLPTVLEEWVGTFPKMEGEE